MGNFKRTKYVTVTLKAAPKKPIYKKTGPYVPIPSNPDKMTKALEKLYKFDPLPSLESGMTTFYGKPKNTTTAQKAFEKIKAYKFKGANLPLKGWPGEVVFHMFTEEYFYVVILRVDSIEVRRSFASKKR